VWRWYFLETKTIKQTATFKADPHEVYEALMDPVKHAKFTGGKARISRKVGGGFSVFDGYAEGKNLELVPNAKIVQTWRANDWPEGFYSKVTFALKVVDGGTRLAFNQVGVPADQYDDVSRGWKDFYWAPMKRMLEK
jgi:activator of HSP90 ATPase